MLMEMLEIAVLGIAIVGTSGFFSLVSAFLVAYVKDLRLEKRIRDLEGDMESLEDSMNGRKGQMVKQEKNEQQAALVKDLGVAVATGKPIPDALKETAMAHPDATLALLKKFVKF